MSFIIKNILQFKISDINSFKTIIETLSKIVSETTFIIHNPKDKKNNLAVPTNGESYAIVRKKIFSGNAPYHIAFVLYTQNNVNITLEAEADNKNDYTPKFGFYDITPNGKTFHRRWSAEMYKDSTDLDKQFRYNVLYNNGETIVLKTRKLNDIIKEMSAELVKPKGRAKKSIKGGLHKKFKNKSRRKKM